MATTFSLVSSSSLQHRDPEATLVRVPPGDVMYATTSTTARFKRIRDRYCAVNRLDCASIVMRFAGSIVEEVCVSVCKDSP